MITGTIERIPTMYVKDTYDDYTVKWVGRLINTNPILNEKGLPKFAIITSTKRIETYTADMSYIEKLAKKLTAPTGNKTTTFDTARIYVIEKNKEVYLGKVVHCRTKEYGVSFIERLED